MPTKKSATRKAASRTPRKAASRTPRKAASGQTSAAASFVGDLVIKIKGLRKNTAKLFKELDQSSKLRESFIQNPAGVLSSKLIGKKRSAQQVSDANRLLFSILANDRFLQWVDDYAVENRGRRVSKAQYSRDFADALLKFGDAKILGSLIQNAAAGNGIPGLGGEVFQQIIINNAAATTFATPVNQPSTSDQTLKSSQNFNGLGFGDLTVVNPAVMRAVTTQLIDRAKELDRAGVLADLNVQIR